MRCRRHRASSLLIWKKDWRCASASRPPAARNDTTSAGSEPVGIGWWARGEESIEAGEGGNVRVELQSCRSKEVDGRMRSSERGIVCDCNTKLETKGVRRL